jgi:hypothetical protein
MRHCEARLTADGLAVLERRADALAWNGIDDQIGGVTLSSAAGTLWVRTEDSLTPV